MISVTHFASGAADFSARAQTALQALARRQGYLRGTLARSADADDAWVMITEWQNIGSYRRALGAYEVKVHATPLLAESVDVPTAFEPLVEVAPGGAALMRDSDRA
jgi:hypothetical protein